MTVQPVHRIGQRRLLVVDRDHHVEHGYAERFGGDRGVGPGFEAAQLIDGEGRRREAGLS